jgi:hypothetical protein
VSYAIIALGVVKSYASRSILTEPWHHALFFALACYGLHWVGSVLDVPYEKLYGASAKHLNWLPWRRKLNEARDTAAVALFGFDENVKSYHDAVMQGYIGAGRTSIGTYKRAAAITKQAGSWEGTVKLTLDLSKAFRTVALTAALWALTAPSSWIDEPTEFGRRLAQPGVLSVAAIGCFLIGMVLRVHHQLALYKVVTPDKEALPAVGHVRLVDGRILMVSAYNSVRLSSVQPESRVQDRQNLQTSFERDAGTAQRR